MRYPAIAITLSVLETLFKTPGICDEFPFIKYVKNVWAQNATRGGGGCRGCGKKPNREHRQHLLETVKAGLVSLPPERIRKFKDLMNTDKVVLHFGVRGKTIVKEL